MEVNPKVADFLAAMKSVACIVQSQGELKGVLSKIRNPAREIPRPAGASE
jgi:hypothetical protein